MTSNEKSSTRRRRTRRWMPLRMWRDVAPLYQYETDPTRRQDAIITRIDDSGFDYLVVVVAAVGFFTDSYDIFAINIVLPILKIVYYEGNISRGLSTTLGCSLLIGTAIGQVLFGVLADNYGRRSMYGIELIMLIVGTLGLTMASSGTYGSMDISAWLIFWRITMGIAIGGDYPLSAVIGAEFAPRKHRARMLAWIFFMQPIGQLLGNLVALAALHANRHYVIGTQITPEGSTCKEDCLRSLDMTWRWIVGIGIIPAVIALYFRVTIPESPRYTLEVAQNYRKAYQEALQYYGQAEPDREQAVYDNIVFMESLDQPPFMESIGEPSQSRPISTRSSQGPTPFNLVAPVIAVESRGAIQHASSSREGRGPGGPSSQAPVFTNNLTGDTTVVPSAHSVHNHRESVYTGRNSFDSHNRHSAAFAEIEIPPYWAEMKKYFIKEGNWKTLFGTSMSWLILDCAFYGLGVNNSTIVKKLWSYESHEDPDVYTTLRDIALRSLVIVVAGALIGSMIVIKMIKHVSRKKLQFWGFIILTILLFVVGWTYLYLIDTPYKGVVIMLYVLCQLFFNLGPNTTTYIMAAEVFPTRLRATGHGISAAAGKLGSIIANVFTNEVEFTKGQHVDADDSKSLAYVLFIFSVLMLLGAVVTWYWVPEVQDSNGDSIGLEELSRGFSAESTDEQN
ncbi:hypothetical protein H072_11399 [Dactylellina haptotyla CBS 200.50]|uniref:Major facilitator superfamily (MFS) profile domain-containing protein n=1 Tax=Dactylellina haptotyla (strain CBS 200.50) TaxID=1284197 RepID=S7ZXA3_DACHA|nr:hypothetical protein H072_11399 [Dactylellina haptotyla CBS 200.50]